MTDISVTCTIPRIAASAAVPGAAATTRVTTRLIKACLQCLRNNTVQPFLSRQLLQEDFDTSRPPVEAPLPNKPLSSFALLAVVLLRGAVSSRGAVQLLLVPLLREVVLVPLVNRKEASVQKQQLLLQRLKLRLDGERQKHSPWAAVLVGRNSHSCSSCSNCICRPCHHWSLLCVPTLRAAETAATLLLLQHALLARPARGLLQQPEARRSSSSVSEGIESTERQVQAAAVEQVKKNEGGEQ